MPVQLPVVFAPPEPGDAELREGRGADAPGIAYFEPGHRAGCACCGGRNGAGLALQRLLHARARAQGPFFQRVAAITRTAAGRAELLRALAEDPLAASCFRLSPGKPEG